MPDIHLKFGGSTAGRTMGCPGWHAQADTLPRAPNSVFAQVGTALHTCMQTALLADDPDSFNFEALEGVEVDGVEITRELIDTKLAPALDAWDQLCDRYGVDVYEVEQMVQLADDTGGTADVIAQCKDTTTIVLDWKFGDGHLVSPQGNPQGLFYTACGRGTEAVQDLFADEGKVVIAIIQPTAREDEALKVWETDIEEVIAFNEKYLAARHIALDATADDYDALHTGEHCLFCPAEAICPAKTGLIDAAKRLPVDSLHGERLNDALSVADEMEGWISAVRKLAHALAEDGERFNDWKLVMKRATQVYTDEAAVEARVKARRKLKFEESHTSKLLSPAQMRKLYKAKEIPFEEVEEHIAKVSSGTTLAKRSDPRAEAPAMGALKALAQRVA